MQSIIAEELNVKEVSVRHDENDLVTYSAKANFKLLGSRLGKHMKTVAQKIQELDSEAIAHLLDGATVKIDYEGDSIEISSSDIVVQRTEREHMKVMNDGSLTVGFDTEVTRELLLEGISRDNVRSVKTAQGSGFDVADRIALSVWGAQDVRDAYEAFGTYIASETLADVMAFEISGAPVEIDCGDVSASIAIRRL